MFWSRFSGTDINYIYEEGLHIISPWNKMYIYDTRVQKTDFMFEALSMDGLPIMFELSVRYYPDKENLPKLHVSVGPNYAEKVVEPEVQANLRKVVAHYIPEEIYTSEGYILQVITQGSLGALAERHIILDNLLIRRMVLPLKIRSAIESKLAQEQISLEYEFRLERETKEAERKKTEAQGILDFQKLVKKGHYFEEYLRFKGIEATLELARSNNAKVVVIGGGGNQLPLIMNMDSGQTKEPTPEQSNPSLLKETNPPETFLNTPADGQIQNDKPESSSFTQPLPQPPSESESVPNSILKPAEPIFPLNSDGNMQSFLDKGIDSRQLNQSLQYPLYSYQGKLSQISPSVRESGQSYSSPAEPKIIKQLPKPSVAPASQQSPNTVIKNTTGEASKNENRTSSGESSKP